MGISFSESHQHFAVKITQKPEGGFVSSSDNPALIFEGATKEEVQQKVMAKIAELGGPDLAAMMRGMKPSAAGSDEQIQVTLNKKTALSFGKKKTIDGGPNFQLKLTRGQSLDGPAAEGGLSPLAKAAIVVAVLLLLLWLGFHK